MKAKKAVSLAKKARKFDYEAWLDQQDLKDLFPPRVLLLTWIGILGMCNYQLVHMVGKTKMPLLFVSTFIVGCALLIGFTLGIEQKKIEGFNRDTK